MRRVSNVALQLSSYKCIPGVRPALQLESTCHYIQAKSQGVTGDMTSSEIVRIKMLNLANKTMISEI